MAVIARTQGLGDLVELAMSWRRALRAQNKSEATISGYLDGVERFGAFLRAERLPTWPRNSRIPTITGGSSL